MRNKFMTVVYHFLRDTSHLYGVTSIELNLTPRKRYISRVKYIHFNALAWSEGSSFEKRFKFKTYVHHFGSTRWSRC